MEDANWQKDVMQEYACVSSIVVTGSFFCLAIQPNTSLRDVRSIIQHLEEVGLSFETYSENKLYMRRSGQWT